MSHTYASRDEFWSFLADTGADSYRAGDSLVLAALEAASRAVDDFCRRTDAEHEPSGFGPRTGTHWYDADGAGELDLGDDLLTASAVQASSSTGATPVTWTENTDFYLLPYDRSPKRRLALVDTGGASMPIGRRLLSIAGTWGYQDVRRPLVATVGTGGWTAGATSLAVSDSGELSPGMTLWTGTQAVYVTSSPGGLVIEGTRGAHGTTAATATQGAALSASVYPSAVRTATLMIAQRRWKARDAGLTGDTFGAGGVPAVAEKAAETAILRAALWGYAFSGSR